MKNLFIPSIKFLGALVSIGGGLLGVIALISHGVMTYKGSEWIEVPTEITYTYSIQAYGGKTSSGLEYYPHPTYAFTANDGQQYTGSTYAIPVGSTRNLNFLGGATNTPVTVYGSIFYNPDNPNQSAVQRPYFNIIPLLFIFLALGFIVLGYFLLEDIWKKRKKEVPI